MKYAIIAIARNENLYIRDWISYHKNLGFTHIYIADNNDINGERLSDEIMDYIDIGYVTVENYIGMRKPKGSFLWYKNINNKKVCIEQQGGGIQQEAYESMFNKYAHLYDWVLIIDIDEYLYLDNITLDELLSNCNDVDTLQLNWLMYGDNEQLFYENKPLNERFPNHAPKNYISKRVKSFIKGSLTDIRLNAHSIHKFNSISKNTQYKYVETDFVQQPCYDNAYIKHFYTKSITEFFNRKFNQHNASTSKNNFYTDIDKFTNEFFKYNNVTEEKILCLDKLYERYKHNTQ